MSKPTKYQHEPCYDYHKAIKWIEDKYEIEVRNYARSLLMKEYRHLHNIAEPKRPLPITINEYNDPKLREEYNQRQTQYIEMYQLQRRNFEEWRKSNDIPEPEYLDFWHWFLDIHDSLIHNGCFVNFGVRDGIESEDTPDWVREILKFIYNEFQEDEMRVWIEW